MKKDTLSRLKAKEREIRQDLIIEAARTVFGEKTYDKASMVEIARKAGISKSSIYTYFTNQEELYVEITLRDTRNFINALDRHIKNATPGEITIRGVIDLFLDYYLVHEAQWRMTTHFALHGNRGKSAVEKLDNVARQVMDLFQKVFKQLGFKADTRLLAHTLFSSLSGILIAFRNYPGRSDAQRQQHMKRIGNMVETLFMALAEQENREEA
ncbi:HTH-type transcriptional regulator (TetR-family protein) [Desulforapulum autotrophicum HRM2]|uniref:HTH-type transcriptional regulator (TetR-family protein) n=1 Tax=Desulforapulum autotrophicum (strain ATCC 43914 / DSM 3382 / VKM B-1955 / HRM2) TaxID=177437 RepID=C0QJY8_DESAH|nr:TetR/AcrR family transcriptional regulator [Desulforapulum autotrophicum]ACN16014.1 HTH-type transcriptional regulator (TetR-family protein) [Desulforapulum autotrophicum HRM2]